MLWKDRALGVSPSLLSGRPRCTGPRHGQCVHVVEVCTIEAAEEDRCAISKRRHAVTISCAWSGTIAAQRRPIHRRS